MRPDIMTSGLPQTHLFKHIHGDAQVMQSPFSYHRLRQNPLTPSLDKLVQEQTQIGEGKSAHVEPKKFSSVPSAELKPNLRLVRVSQSRVVHLPGYLVCTLSVLLSPKLSSLTDSLCGVKQPGQRAHVVRVGPDKLNLRDVSLGRSAGGLWHHGQGWHGGCVLDSLCPGTLVVE